MAETPQGWPNLLNGTESLDYSESPWGDVVGGTKEQLQALGVGVGVAFPGEDGGPKRVLNTTDPRGFATKVTQCRNDRGYSASIVFPHLPPKPEWRSVAFALGVTKIESFSYDRYVGSADALEAIGLVHREHLPGMPGMRKVTVTVYADGTLPSGGPTASAKEPGAKHIEKATGGRYEVHVWLSDDIRQARRDAYKQAEHAWEERARALPRPPRLGRPAAVQRARGSLRLVWSAPAP